MPKIELLYQFAGILCGFAQFLVAFASFMSGRPREGCIGILFGIANCLIYLWR